MPFTCELIPHRDRFLKAATGVLIILLLVFPVLARAEGAVLEHQAALPVFIGLLMGTLIWLDRRGANEPDKLVFQDGGHDTFVLLRLGAEQ